MTARHVVAAGVAGVLAGGAAAWFVLSSRQSPPSDVYDIVSMSDTAAVAVPGAPVATLDTSGPMTLRLRVISYADTATLAQGRDPAGVLTSLETVFAPYKLNITVEREAAPRPYPFGDGYLRQDELDGLATEPQAPGDGWKVTAFMLRRGMKPGDLGRLLRPDRGHFVVFADEHGNNPGRLLRTTAHEFGHALNMFHNDGDASDPCCDTGNGAGTTLMNQARCLDRTGWKFRFSVDEETHLRHHPLQSVEPGPAVLFGVCTKNHQKTC